MISIVIPVYNEAESLSELYAEIAAISHSQKYELDLIFVDDGSTDDSWEEIQRLAATDARIRGMRFRRNFGKAAALSAGFDAALGQLVMTLDADLQDDPREIPRFLEMMDQGLDVVSGWKQRRHDPWHKVWPSRIFNRMVSWMTGVRLHDHNCGFKCYRAEIFREVKLYGELHRFVPVLAAARGYRVGEIVVHHRPRQHGQSKYGWLRIPKGLLDLLTVKFLTGYGQRPQHLLGSAGLLCFAVGAGLLAYLTFLWCFSRLAVTWNWEGWQPVHLHQRAMFYYSLAILFVGTQFMTVGFLAELLTAYTRRDVAPYSVADRTHGLADWSRRGDQPARPHSGHRERIPAREIAQSRIDNV